jgi:4-hydroxy-4-methyl-2-oxoglutarate aldolase
VSVAKPGKDEIARARTLGSATLHEAAGRIGALPAAIRPVVPEWLLAGPAFTVHTPAIDNLWIHRALYKAEPGDILVVYVSQGYEAGYWGEILNEAAMARGLGGLVIDGGVRDAAQLAKASFPVFSRGLAIRGTGKDRGAIAWTGQPVRIGEVTIAPGDLVVGDIDGVVAIPQARVADVLAASDRRIADETEKIRRIRAGERTIDLYGFGEG